MPSCFGLFLRWAFQCPWRVNRLVRCGREACGQTVDSRLSSARHCYAAKPFIRRVAEVAINTARKVRFHDERQAQAPAAFGDRAMCARDGLWTKFRASTSACRPLSPPIVLRVRWGKFRCAVSALGSCRANARPAWLIPSCWQAQVCLFAQLFSQCRCGAIAWVRMVRGRNSACGYGGGRRVAPRLARLAWRKVSNAAG